MAVSACNQSTGGEKGGILRAPYQAPAQLKPRASSSVRDQFSLKVVRQVVIKNLNFKKAKHYTANFKNYQANKQTIITCHTINKTKTNLNIKSKTTHMQTFLNIVKLKNQRFVKNLNRKYLEFKV